ncbi:MAG: hypothetical protein AAGA68_13195 [Pseudomonadota bacterium]
MRRNWGRTLAVLLVAGACSSPVWAEPESPWLPTRAAAADVGESYAGYRQLLTLYERFRALAQGEWH